MYLTDGRTIFVLEKKCGGRMNTKADCRFVSRQIVVKMNREMTIVKNDVIEFYVRQLICFLVPFCEQPTIHYITREIAEKQFIRLLFSCLIILVINENLM